MRIALIQPPDELEAMLGVGQAFVSKFEPLGLLYIAAVALEAGHEVSVIDAHAEGLDCAALQQRLAAARPEVVGLSVLTCNGSAAFDLGRWIKRELPGALVVLGNIHASIYARQYLEHGCCDMVVHGEGEYPFLKILDYRAGRCSLADIPAISYVRPGGGVALPQSSPYLVDDLAALPRPARRLVKQELYQVGTITNQLYIGRAGGVFKTMSTSRGCWGRCTFCAVNQRPRFNSAEAVVDEMEDLEKNFGADYAFLFDPVCLQDRPRVNRICAEIRRRRLRLRWGATARVDYITPEIVRTLASANCHDLSFGIESGVQRLLDRVQKGTTIARVTEAIKAVKEQSAILVGGLFILGLPGESREDSLQTIRYATSLPLDMAQFSICTPYPGSALFETLRAQGALDTGVRPDGSVDASVWKRYSAYISFANKDPIWTTPEQSPAQLRKLQKKAIRDFYLRPAIILKHLSRLRPGNIWRALDILWKALR